MRGLSSRNDNEESMTTPVKDHLFISYATEDGPLAEWLTLKLTSEGYAVWCDRVKLLGGESYPTDIDVAMKERTFRVLALLSHASIQKENPKKERTLALNLGRERKMDFLIPLNVSALKPTELDWMTSDLTFIPFNNWAVGLDQVLKKLKSLDAPKLLGEGGREIAAASFLPRSVTTSGPESLYLNQVRFKAVPLGIRKFDLGRELSVAEMAELIDQWPIRRASKRRVLSFTPPPAEASSKYGIMPAGQVAWGSVPKIEDLYSRDIVSTILDRTLKQYLKRRGLQLMPDFETAFFPRALTESDRLEFIDYKGKKNWLKTVGERSVRTLAGPKKYAYHLAANFRIRRDAQGFSALIRLRIHVCELDGTPLAPTITNRRRKKVARSWWNHHWLTRQLAILQFLSAGKEEIELNPKPNEIVLSAVPERVEVPYGIDEVKLRGKAEADVVEVEPAVVEEVETEAEVDV